MSRVYRYLGDVFSFSRVQLPRPVRQKVGARSLTRLAEGDRVLVDRAKLTVPLQRNAKSNFSKGDIRHNDLIGQPLSPAYVRTSRGTLHRVEAPSLEEYVTLAPRLVTPVYASYAASIVSVLDIHADPFQESESSYEDPSPKLEILEAGTGNGSLTLHLARAIAAANPPPPNAEISKLKETAGLGRNHEAIAQVWEEWKQTRRAILHTVENVVANRFHAEKLVRGFRQGLYWPHVDFFVNDVKHWIDEQFKLRGSVSDGPLFETGNGFLDYVVLDMPDIHSQLRHVHPALRDGGKFLVFVPSITQIGECVRLIQDESLPFTLERVMELGEGISTGRAWDVRMVRPRRSRLPGAEATTTTTTPPPQTMATFAADPMQISDPNATEEEISTENAEDFASGEEPETDSDLEESAPAEVPQDQPQPDHSVMICRPLVGQRTVGGGFIALFRKTPPDFLRLTPEWRRSQTGKAKKRYRA